jgi:sortase A
MRALDRLVVRSPLCDDKGVVGEFHLSATARPRRVKDRSDAPVARSSRALRVLAATLIALGTLALADAVVTLLWQEPISALYATIRQDRLNGALAKIEHAAPSPGEQRALASLSDERNRIAFLAGELERHAGEGDPVGRIEIPRVGVSYVIVNGTSTDDLKSGPGIYAETGFPGIAGTTAIAGHRTTYLAPFRDINLLVPGNRILVNMPYGHFTYTVVGHEVVSPNDVEAAVASVGYSRVVLSACTPLFSAAKRLLVFARLTRTVPAGAARELPGGAQPRAIEPDRVQAPGEREVLQRMLESMQPDSISSLV